MARGWGAFRVSQPAVEDFPHRVWLRLVARHSRDHRQGVLGYGDPMGHVPADLVPRFVAAREASDIFPPTFPQAVLADFIDEDADGEQAVENGAREERTPLDSRILRPPTRPCSGRSKVRQGR